MSDPGASYLRCRHCKGFYETAFARCKWCDYDAPLPGRDGSPRVFPDRATCRAIQLAEYEQLPAEAHDDHMGPPKEDPSLLCNCLHCGPDGHRFEAIEMRWMANERMWACPCTTCGGRGFGIDVHSAENKWQCAACGHFYVPEDRDYRWDNAKCPKCGCTEASGWFDDEDVLDDEDDDDEFDDVDEDDEDDAVEYDAGHGWRDADQDVDDDDLSFSTGDEADGRRIPDDIDHPQPDRPQRGDPEFNDDDIPF